MKRNIATKIAAAALLAASLNATAGAVWDSNGAYIPPSDRQNNVSDTQTSYQNAPSTYHSPNTYSQQAAATLDNLDNSLREEVTVNIRGMNYGDFLTQLAPSGWRIEFRGVSQNMLNKSVDAVYINIPRGSVLRDTLEAQGLNIRFYERQHGFPEPRLVISDF